MIDNIYTNLLSPKKEVVNNAGKKTGDKLYSEYLIECITLFIQVIIEFDSDIPIDLKSP
jgi:hypothetical protein